MTTRKVGAKKSTKKGSNTKTGVEKPDRRILQSSPITIGGGGSVKLKFDQGRYPLNANGEHSSEHDELITVLVADEDFELQNFYGVVEGKDCTVKIVCRFRGQEGIIKLHSRPGGPLVIDFDELDFPYDTGLGHWYSGNLKIEEMSIVDNTTHGSTFANIPQNGKCGIFAINLL